MKQGSVEFSWLRVVQLTVLALSLTAIFCNPARANEPALAAATPARLVIPSIYLDSPITPVGIKPLVINGQTYGTWEVADNTVGWHNLSAGLGRAGNTVLAGHSDVKARVFKNLRYVTPGDEIIVFANGRAHRYVVTQKVFVREKGVSLETRIKNAQWIAPTGDERLTLVTCARPGATHRLIVVARPKTELP